MGVQSVKISTATEGGHTVSVGQTVSSGSSITISGSWNAGATQKLEPISDESAYEAWMRLYFYPDNKRQQVQQWTERSAQVKVTHVGSHSNAAVFPGALATSVVLDHAKTYRRLVNLVDRFQSSGSPFASSSNMRISKDSADAARAFLEATEQYGKPPKIGTDDDSVVFAWEAPDATTLVIVDGWRLHLVERAGTATSSYTDELSFDGNELPDRISSVVPAR